MDCREAENLYEPYVLGALDSEERSLVDSHLDDCDDCSQRLQLDHETMFQLALAVPQMSPPVRVKQRLLGRVDAELHPRRRPGFGRVLAGLLGPLARPAVACSGAVVASILVGVVFGGLWVNDRINRVTEESEELTQEVVGLEANVEELSREVVGLEANVMEMVKSQRDLA